MDKVFKQLQINGFDANDYSGEKMKDLKIDVNNIGHCVVIRTRPVERLMGGFISESSKSPLVYCAYRITWYDYDRFNNMSYKCRLVPIGNSRAVATDIVRYTSTIESIIYAQEGLFFEDPIEAAQVAAELNKIAHPRKKDNKFKSLIKKIFNHG